MSNWREIPEAHAEGETLALYQDIRAITKIPVVNLAFRHLATIPRALPWVWTTLRPMYESGSAARLGAKVIEDARLPELPPIPNIYLRAATLSAADMSDIANIIDTYVRGNAMNLVAMSTLCRFIDRLDALPKCASLLNEPIGTIELPSIRAIRPILSLENLDDSTRTLVARLEQIGGTPEPNSIKPSLYRHLAHWPSFLCLAGTYLLLPERNGSLATASAAVRDAADSVASTICGSLRPPHEHIPEEPDFSRIRVAIGRFTLTIARLLPISVLLRRALPILPLIAACLLL